jgi:Tfp pilus assembly protein PilF
VFAYRHLIPVALLILIAGCTTTPVSEPVETSPEIAALVQRADQYRLQGEYARAQSVLEQALRIDARNPRTWYQLASLKLDEGVLDSAETFAKKSLRYSGPESREAAQNWLLISEIRRRLGDKTGAAQALDKAQAIGRSLQ